MSFDLILPFFPAAVRSLITDPTVSDIMINGTTGLYVERGGLLSQVSDVHLNNDHLVAVAENIARALDDDINEDMPILDARLPDNSRVAAVFPPASIHGVVITIRKFIKWFTTDELIAKGSLPASVSAELISSLLAKDNLLISGGTGSGKSTAGSALIRHIPHSERLAVIKKPAELFIAQPNVVRFEAVKANKNRPGVTMSELLSASLRHRPDRIVIGETKDSPSAYALLQAMNTGHSGTISTIHADGALKALYRMSGLALGAHTNLDHRFVRSETADAINLVLHVERGADGKRSVREFIRVKGYSTITDQFEFDTLYRA